MIDYSIEVDEWYVFADTYIALASSTSAPTDDLHMIELLFWIVADKRRLHCLMESLDQIVWLRTWYPPPGKRQRTREAMPIYHWLSTP